jgi:polar amino acid transport system permease protein
MMDFFPEVLTFGRTGFADELLRGTFFTVLISAASYLLGLILGMIGAVAKLYGGTIAQAIAGFYTTVVRGIPELVLILFLFFAGTRGISILSQAIGFGPVDVNGGVAAVLVLGFVYGAYSTEVIRGAIQAIPTGQIEAAKAFGMSRWQMMGRIIIPAMLPNALPGLSNLWLAMLKDSALVVVTGASPELAMATKLAAGFTKQYFLFYFVALMIYLGLTLISNWAIGRIEKNMRRGQQALA